MLGAKGRKGCLHFSSKVSTVANPFVGDCHATRNARLIQLMHSENDSLPASSSAPLIDVGALTQALAAFAAERDWDQYHSPKNLVMALTGEVGELTEIFQWLSEEASQSAAHSPETATAVREELADVTLYLVRLASVLGVDLNEAVTQKLQKNAHRYPVNKARGNHKKYNVL